MRGQPLKKDIWFLHWGKKKQGSQMSLLESKRSFISHPVSTSIATSVQSKQGGSGKAPPALGHKAGPHVQEEEK
jgi:hypothetical protein